jgi:hypothetical protein
MPISYNIKGMKRPTEVTEYTPEMVQEYVKCATDILYFAEHYYYITSTHNNKGKQLVKLYEFQKDILRGLVKNDHVILNAARQVGKSTCSCIFLLWYALFNKDIEIAILANKQRTATELMSDVKSAYLELPNWLKPAALKYDELNIEFDSGTKIIAAATSKDAIRGRSISALLIDEFAHLPSNIAEEFWTAVLPTISNGGKCIVVSTPNGAGGLFYDLWRKATLQIEDCDFIPFKARWDVVPGRDEQWKKNMISSMNSIVKFNQEFDCNFSGSSNTLIEGTTLERLVSQVPLIVPEEGYSIWKAPIKNRIYLASCDVAKGVNSDFSVVDIYDVTTWHVNGRYDQVAQLRTNSLALLPEFKPKVVQICRQWNNCALIIENNNLGDVLAKAIHEEDEYENLYYDYERKELGVNANVKTKPLACRHYKEDLETSVLTIRSTDTIKELATFEEVMSGVFKARKGNSYHDDTVTTGYWAAYCLRSKWWEDHLHDIRKNSKVALLGSGSKSSSLINNQVKDPDEEILNRFMNVFDDDFEDELKGFTAGLGKF